MTTRNEYDEVKQKVEQLIAEATAKGMLEPEMDNEYTREIAELSRQLATYEDTYMDLKPLREKSPLIRSIEDYFYAHNMRQKDGAHLLDVNETDSVRQARVASEIDRFFGGWSDDPRTTDEIMQQIREGRTENTYPKL